MTTKTDLSNISINRFECPNCYGNIWRELEDGRVQCIGGLLCRNKIFTKEEVIKANWDEQEAIRVNYDDQD